MAFANLNAQSIEATWVACFTGLEKPWRSLVSYINFIHFWINWIEWKGSIPDAITIDGIRPQQGQVFLSWQRFTEVQPQQRNLWKNQSCCIAFFVICLGWCGWPWIERNGRRTRKTGVSIAVITVIRGFNGFHINGANRSFSIVLTIRIVCMQL